MRDALADAVRRHRQQVWQETVEMEPVGHRRRSAIMPHGAAEHPPRHPLRNRSRRGTIARMATSIRFDIVHGGAPWCAIGTAALEIALAKVGAEAAGDDRLPPARAQSRPPARGGGGGGKHGAQQRRASRRRRRAGACGRRRPKSGRSVGAAGTTVRYVRCAPPAPLGRRGGRAARAEEGIARGLFGRGENVSDAVVLVAAAERAGLDADEARAVLAEGRYAGEVRAAAAWWRGEGVYSVPTIVIDGRYVVTGAQSPDRLEKAIRRRLAETAAESAV
ncbi:DsbA family protein [Sphingomonas sp. MMS24-JH45]